MGSLQSQINPKTNFTASSVSLSFTLEILPSLLINLTLSMALISVGKITDSLSKPDPFEVTFTTDKPV